MNCVLCHKKLLFLACWVPENMIFLNKEAGHIICGGCRENILVSLPSIKNIRYLPNIKYTCAVCNRTFVSVNATTLGIRLIQIPGNYTICEDCLRNITPSKAEGKTEPAITETNAV